MRPWMGALAAAVAIAVVPASALADDGESVVEFKLPNKAAGDQLANLGFDIGDGYDQSVPGQIKATIVVTPEQKAQLEAMGYPAVDTIMNPGDADALRAARNATLASEAAAKAALNSAAANKSKSAAAGTVRAQHADYWEDAGGRWLSIEGTTTQAVGDRHQLQRPAAGRVLVHRPRQPRSAAATCPRCWTRTSRRGRTSTTSPSTAWATPRRSARRCRRSSASRPRTGTSRSSPSRSGSATAPRSTPPGSRRTSSPTTSIRRRATRRSRRWPASSPTSRRSLTCRTRRRATSASRRPCSASPPPTPAAPARRPRPTRPARSS